MMQPLRNLRLKCKLMLVILLSCGASAIAASVALFLFQTATMHKSFERDLDTLTEVLASQCAGPLAFGDAAAAREVLGSLKARPEIVSGVIYLPDGSRFAESGEVYTEHIPGSSSGGWLGWLRPPELSAEHPVAWQDNPAGRLVLRADYTRTYRDLQRLSLSFLGTVLIGSLGVGFLVSSALQGLISAPITRLAATARKIAEEKDYSVRAASLGTDEVGALTEAFNQMLDRIHTDATSLQTMNQDLVQEISERRRAERALQESEERYRTVFENASIGIYRSAADGRMLLANPALVRMLGYHTVAELQALDPVAGLHADPKDRARLQTELGAQGEVRDLESLWLKRDGEKIWIRENARATLDHQTGEKVHEGVVEDITARKAAEAELQRLNRELMDASRHAGMAEVATGVLHNVGNVLNSVNVSVNVLHDRLGKSKVQSLVKTAALLRQRNGDLAEFLTQDPKGRLVPGFVIDLADRLATEQQGLLEEIRQLSENVAHIKEIVAMQQSYAQVAGVTETLPPSVLVEDALRLNTGALLRHGVTVERQFAEVPKVAVDRHKVLQILINLIRNAKYAMDDHAGITEKRLVLVVEPKGADRVQIRVLDNGVGIPPENLTKIFNHGFTTKKDGHGFGLHSGALAAKELGGSLTAHSQGAGHGAEFILELPAAPQENPREHLATTCAKS